MTYSFYDRLRPGTFNTVIIHKSNTSPDALLAVRMRINPEYEYGDGFTLYVW
jgi:hypothetical protein